MSETPVGAPEPPRGTAERLAAVRSELHLAAGDVDRARAEVERLGDARSPEVSAARVRVALAERDAAQARRLLEAWDNADTPAARIDQLLLRAATVALEGNRDAARECVVDAVRLAEPEGHLRPLAGACPTVAEILRSLAVETPGPFLRAVVESLAGTAVEEGRPDDLIEKLTERELTVLRYLARRMSNAEIAAALFVSPNTLKSHVKHVYWKLGVNRRDDAVRAAVRLGLL
jgi:LuxR family maltose regulon positive regulatory protein